MISNTLSFSLTVRSVISALLNQYSLQVSTLRFASRMRCVRTDPAVNEHMDAAVSSKNDTKLLWEVIITNNTYCLCLPPALCRL